MDTQPDRSKWLNYKPSGSTKPVKRRRYVTTERIGPERAQQLLDNNTRNRPLKPARIRMYEESMNNGEWGRSNDQIVVAWDGTLLNGQNRLHAIIRSGTTQEFDVSYGNDPRDFIHMDSGQPRDLADHLHTLGYPQRTSMASVTLKLAGWIKAGQMTEYTVRGLSQTAGNAGTTSRAQQIEVGERWADAILESIRLAQRLNEERVMSESFMAFLLLAFQHRWPGAEDFATRVFTGIGIVSPTDPAAVFRRMLLKNAMLDKDRGKQSDVAMFAYGVLASNLAMKGAKRKVLKWQPTEDEPFPQPRVDTLSDFAAPFAWAADKS